MNSPGWIVVAIIVVCAASARLGRSRRESGKPITPRITVTVMAAAWGLAWLAIGLGSLPANGSWREPLALLGLATAPLLLVLAAIYLPTINSAAKHAGKKILERHPLDP